MSDEESAEVQGAAQVSQIRLTGAIVSINNINPWPQAINHGLFPDKTLSETYISCSNMRNHE
jgi:hypothetical protein